MKKYTLKRGALAFGKMLPVGIGALIGGGGNRVMGKKIGRQFASAFGSAPARWPSVACLPLMLEMHVTGKARCSRADLPVRWPQFAS